MQPRILYPARLSFRMDEEIKRFQDGREKKKYVTKASPTRNIKGDPENEEKPQESHRPERNRNPTETGTFRNTMAVNSYLSKVTLNMNGLHTPIKTHRDSD